MTSELLFSALLLMIPRRNHPRGDKCNAHVIGLDKINNNHNLNPQLGISLVVRIEDYVL